MTGAAIQDLTNLEAFEQGKYRTVWQAPGYLDHSPGEYWAKRAFRQLTHARPSATVIDLGAGAGAGSWQLFLQGFTVTALEFVSEQFQYGLDIPFIEQPLWKPIPLRSNGRRYRWGFCCDVMEHISEELVDPVLENIAQACEGVFFSISHEPDHFGKVVGHPLHLTVKPYEWWLERLRRHFVWTPDSRDLIREGLYYCRAA